MSVLFSAASGVRPIRWKRRFFDRASRFLKPDGTHVSGSRHFGRIFKQTYVRFALLAVLSVTLLAGLAGCSAHFAPPGFSSTPAKGAHVTFLYPQGPVAAAQRTHFFDILALLTVVVAPVFLFVPIIAWRYRLRARSSRYEPRWSFNGPLEFVIWGVPHAVVIVLAVWLWQESIALDPYKPLAPNDPPLRVDVIGYDWKWLFVYPDYKIATLGEFAFPADRAVAITLTSDTVMQSFFIPALGSQIYAMAGMVTHLHLQANQPGKFRGENTQYNGDGFYQQRFLARAMSPSDFKAWTALVHSKGIALVPPVYRAIARRSTVAETKKAVHVDNTPEGVLYIKSVPPELLQSVVASFHGGPKGAAAICRGDASVADSAPAADHLIDAASAR
jgi:cytochrome o ubiquinol oxidase subunit II